MRDRRFPLRGWCARLAQCRSVLRGASFCRLPRRLRTWRTDLPPCDDRPSRGRLRRVARRPFKNLHRTRGVTKSPVLWVIQISGQCLNEDTPESAIVPPDMKELSRPTATLREEDTLIEISSRGVFTRIIRFEHRLPQPKGMRPARRTASQQLGIRYKMQLDFRRPSWVSSVT